MRLLGEICLPEREETASRSLSVLLSFPQDRRAVPLDLLFRGEFSRETVSLLDDGSLVAQIEPPASCTITVCYSKLPKPVVPLEDCNEDEVKIIISPLRARDREETLDGSLVSRQTFSSGEIGRTGSSKDGYSQLSQPRRCRQT
jgi:hypothetical protein